MRRREISMLLIAAATAPGAETMAASGSSSVAPQSDAGPQSAGEARAKIAPHDGTYREGDIRRYGARIDAADNSAAIDDALSVSAQGGSPAFIPAGRWTITRALQVPGNSSMHGVGNASIVVAQDCDGLVFASSGDYAVTGLSRFFRDFQIFGGDQTQSSHRAIVVDFKAKSTQRVNAARFENVHIAHFAVGAYLRGLWFSEFTACHFYNCYRGIMFVGENCVNSLVNCSLNRGNIAGGGGGAWGVSFETTDGESTQSTRIISGQIYFYDILINVQLAFELQIEHCDLSAAQAVGVQIAGTIGGCWVRDCWIETTSANPTVGIKVLNITPSVYTCVHIVGNHVNCDTPAAGSQGISVGNANAGIIVNENAIVGFDQSITLGASAHLICKFNRLVCVTAAYGTLSHAVLLDSLSSDNEIGPNEVVAGKSQPAAMRRGRPEIRVADSKGFPSGTAVEFDADANGFVRGAAYVVLSSGSNVITVGTSRNGAAVAAADDQPFNVFAAPPPLLLTGGAPRGLSFYGRGAFLTSLSGFAAELCAVFNWSANGRLIALCPASAQPILGSSNSTSMTAGDLPEFLRPQSQQVACASVQDAGVSGLGVARINASGILEFFKSGGLEEFTPSGRKGICNHTIVYSYG